MRVEKDDEMAVGKHLQQIQYIQCNANQLCMHQCAWVDLEWFGRAEKSNSVEWETIEKTAFH